MYIYRKTHKFILTENENSERTVKDNREKARADIPTKNVA